MAAQKKAARGYKRQSWAPQEQDRRKYREKGTATVPFPLGKNSVVYLQQFLITSHRESQLLFVLSFATLLPLQQSFLKGCLLLSLDGKSNVLHVHVLSALAFLHDQMILQCSYATISHSSVKASPCFLQTFIQSRTSETEITQQLCG